MTAILMVEHLRTYQEEATVIEAKNIHDLTRPMITNTDIGVFIDYLLIVSDPYIQFKKRLDKETNTAGNYH
ncbi:hypothetical protein Y032_0275g1043 [Ancylostoma ceylanicum]|uniref:Uncharacterized protein n=1 Tax=Ancylostoma ceylanicum TaxID=53326 RepID=A0A016S8H8_9BILA|nr:hypothetical protein Y032_0275g1043 [Ancylostoma ceylanicum]